MRVNFVEVWRRLREASPTLRRPMQRSTSSSLAAFARAKYFAINVLTADQRELSQRFSSTVADKFDGVGAVSGHGGIPLINGCAFDRANVRLGSKSEKLRASICFPLCPRERTLRNTVGNVSCCQ